MNVFGVLHKMTKLIMTVCLLMTATTANSADILDYLTDKDGRYTGPTVEQNVATMDTDKNGFADVMEVRAFLALKHGKDYEKGVLDRWEVRAMGGGCPIPFAKEFVSESKN
jgi:hypothetical protein